MRRRLVALAAALAVIAIAACRDNPNIDGAKVAVSAATCPDVCHRLDALCGMAPSDCTDDDAGGYCDTQLTDYLDCMSTASSCQAAWDCTTVVADDDASADEAAADEAGADDAGTDDAAPE